jgi:glycosyltransferase involved in cell wall biosynthesis
MELRNKTQIAILLAVYNGERYLAEQIDSLISQTFKDWTLYIRDDNSNDTTPEIIRRYCSEYQNIIEIKDKLGNLGCYRNFFQLVKVVDSEYYMFCDGDDVWLPNKIEVTMNRMKEIELKYPKKPLIVHTDKIVVDENLILMANSHWESINLNPDKFLTYNLLGVCSCIGGATMLFNRSVKFISMPIPNVNVAHDLWLSLKTIKLGFISTLHVPTIKYRQHNVNVSGVKISSDSSYSIKYKLFNIVDILRLNKKKAIILKQINWGSFLKYGFYKLIVFFKTRF